jgi:hypothetical protein
VSICAWLKAHDVAYEIIMGDCIHVERFFNAKTMTVAPTVAELQGEVSWIDPGLIRNRANQPLSRRKGYLIERVPSGNVWFYGS